MHFPKGVLKAGRRIKGIKISRGILYYLSSFIIEMNGSLPVFIKASVSMK
jgi:hypothetical protein